MTPEQRAAAVMACDWEAPDYAMGPDDGDEVAFTAVDRPRLERLIAEAIRAAVEEREEAIIAMLWQDDGVKLWACERLADAIRSRPACP